MDQTANEEDYTWESCCFRLDQRCVVFTVQTLLGMALLVFSAYMLSTEENCDRAAPYWGLIGTIAGFFFNKMSSTPYSINEHAVHRQVVSIPRTPVVQPRVVQSRPPV